MLNNQKCFLLKQFFNQIKKRVSAKKKTWSFLSTFSRHLFMVRQNFLTRVKVKESRNILYSFNFWPNI